MNCEEQYITTPLVGEISDFTGPVAFHKVDETLREPLWDHLVRKYHYLGYDSMIGCRVKYLLSLGNRLVGAISFCSAAYKLGPRDLYVGWDEKTRLLYLPHLLNNNRFLIFPWIRVKNLASHILAMSLNRVREDWTKQFDVEPYMVETFVNRNKYRGTCYLADNWVYLGTTKGFGRQGNSFVYHGEEKDLYVIIMNRRFAKVFRLDIGRLPNQEEEILKMIHGIPMYDPTILKRMGVENLSFETFRELLAKHLTPYFQYLGRKEHTAHFVAYIQGLLSDLERKSAMNIAIAYEGVSEIRNMNNFLTQALFDEKGMLELYQSELGEILSHPLGMITGDGCDFPKKGYNSVGVARQYCGRLGKVDSCQASIMIGFASPEGKGLADYELYLPHSWFGDDHEELRERCKVPKDLEFKTKNQLLGEMVNNAVKSGKFTGRYVGVDSSFGKDHDFLDSLPETLVYFADVPNNHQVFKGRPDMVVPEYKGRGRKPMEAPSFPPQNVKTIGQDPSIPWQDVVLGIGAKGPIIAKDKCIQVVEVRDGKPGRDIWLYVRMLEDGSVKHSLCNEAIDASPEKIRIPALMRWSIEQCFGECKDYLGMDHYESRSWPAWKRHILFVYIAHLFITKLRRMFSITVDTPGPAPIVLSPVSLADYGNAIIQAQSNSPIDHKDISATPVGPQQILTIGLLRRLIQVHLPKVGKALEIADNELKQIAQTFASHSKVKVRLVLQMVPGTG